MGGYGTEISCRLAIADLATKTLTPVPDIPLHRGGYGGNVFIEDGKAWLAVNTGTEAYVWGIDIHTGKASKGAKIEGYDLPVIGRF